MPSLFNFISGETNIRPERKKQQLDGRSRQIIRLFL